jgi:hypothetical protein
VLLAGVRDELTDRAWVPPGRHWPQFPDLTGGQDLQAGGTWLAVAAAVPRVACVLNGLGQPAPAATRLSRGTLPLRAAAGEPLDRGALARLDPFRLVVADPDGAVIQSWDGRDLTERSLPPGLHVVVNSGLASDLCSAATTGAGQSAAERSAAPPPDGREHERARIAHFLGQFRSAARPDPRPGQPVSDAWGAWFPLSTATASTRSQRALIVRRDLGNGRTGGRRRSRWWRWNPAGCATTSPAAGQAKIWYSVL